MEQTQSITSLAASSRNVEIASRNTRSDIQAIAMPLLRTSTFFPLLPPPFLLFLLLFNQLEKPTSPSPPTYATFRPTITRWPSPDFPDCHVCKRMAETKVHYQVGDCARCLLCDRPYCKRHKGEEVDVCEINHMTYYRRHHTPGRIFPSMDARKYWGRVKGLDGGRDRGV